MAIFEAFETLAGSTCGTYTLREICADMIDAHTQAIGDNSQYDMREELARASDDDAEIMDDIIRDCIDALNEADDILPPSCTVDWHDGEILVLPYIDDDVPRVAGLPDGPTDDGLVYVVNDHGNVGCYAWNGSDWLYQWGMV